jgi:hypothetical protein
LLIEGQDRQVSNRGDLEIETQLKKLFARARELPVPQDPFLKTRVLGGYRSKAGKIEKSFAWKWLALASSALSLSLVAWIYISSQSQIYKAAMNEAVVVRVEVQDLQKMQIARADIELPEGVHFYSQAHPELSAERSLSVAWNGAANQTKFPFVIKSEASGKKMVHVSFFDSHNKLVATRDLEIRFL